MLSNLYQEAQSFADDLVAYRRELHQMPETDLTLPQTSAFVRQKLTEFGVPFKTLVDGNCVLAQLGHGKPCIMLRADMDALPIKEETGLPFASTNGNMHACGHDMHATSMLGAARLLKAHEGELKGTVKLLFQPGEETFRGARAAIADGVLENPHVDAAFGMHTFAGTPFGTIQYGEVSMAAVYGFRITITGKGCHGSAPEEGVDPIAVGVQIHLALQELLSREAAPRDEASLTVGSFQAGNAANAIPTTAVLQGTLRTFDPEVRAFLIKRIQELVPAIAAAYRATATVETIMDVPAVHNDPALMKECLQYLGEVNPAYTFEGGMHLMGSEDFSLYGEKVPATYVVVGGWDDGVNEAIPQHNSKIRFNERELPQAAANYAAVALGWLENHAQ